MSVQASAPTYNGDYIAAENRPSISIDVPPSRVKGRALSRAARWATGAAALAALASVLAACHTTRVVWAKPGGDDAALQSDIQTCGYRGPATTQTYQPPTIPRPYLPTPTASGYPLGTAGSMTPVHADDSAKSATIDVPDAQRSPVSCMIAHGWRLTPLP